MPTTTATTQTFFLSSDSGPVFSIYRAPKNNLTSKQAVLIIPPFAEEMNKSRRMFSLLSWALADVGIASLLIDLHGTGDSAGDFADATWEKWQADINAAMHWLKSKEINTISVVALRGGALLAADHIQSSDYSFKQLVLWQPITRGDTMMGQFLRLRLAASMFGDGEKKESSNELKEQLEAGQSLEIAGYELPAKLYQTINKKSLTQFIPAKSIEVNWIDVVSQDPPVNSPASLKLVEQWHEQGIRCECEAVQGQPFWLMQEINVVPELIEKTVKLLQVD